MTSLHVAPYRLKDRLKTTKWKTMTISSEVKLFHVAYLQLEKQSHLPIKVQAICLCSQSLHDPHSTLVSVVNNQRFIRLKRWGLLYLPAYSHQYQLDCLSVLAAAPIMVETKKTHLITRHNFWTIFSVQLIAVIMISNFTCIYALKSPSVWAAYLRVPLRR